MPSHQRKNGNSNNALHGRVARAIFAATEAVGISDRNLAEQLTQQVISRLDKGPMGARLPFPGMEDVLGEDASNISDSSVESMIEEALGEMGHPEIAEAYRSLKDDSAPRKIREKPQRLIVKEAKPMQTMQAATAKLSPNAIRVLEKLRRSNT